MVPHSTRFFLVKFGTKICNTPHRVFTCYFQIGLKIDRHTNKHTFWHFCIPKYLESNIHMNIHPPSKNTDVCCGNYCESNCPALMHPRAICCLLKKPTSLTPSGGRKLQLYGVMRCEKNLNIPVSTSSPVNGQKVISCAQLCCFLRHQILHDLRHAVLHNTHKISNKWSLTVSCKDKPQNDC